MINNEEIEKYRYFIRSNGKIIPYHSEYTVGVEKRKEIGNDFSSIEEAEKAVEKLKAIKKLKDYNVKFNLDFVKNKIDFTYTINNPLLDVLDGEEQIFNNMKTIFEGEE